MAEIYIPIVTLGIVIASILKNENSGVSVA